MNNNAARKLPSAKISEPGGVMSVAFIVSLKVGFVNQGGVDALPKQIIGEFQAFAGLLLNLN